MTDMLHVLAVCRRVVFFRTRTVHPNRCLVILGIGHLSAPNVPNGGSPRPAQLPPLKKIGWSGARCDLIYSSELASSIIH
jgi:hypothetical protein